ncbi:MAG: DUF2206 domain-containing protein [Candidatus Hodarchaeota archaeon]
MNYIIKLIFVSYLMMLFSIIFNIPVIRQSIVFLFIFFIPGFFMLKLFKIVVKDRLKILLYSIGLSISFLMMLGLIINEMYPIFGILNPLSLKSLLITLSIIILIFILLIFSQNNKNINLIIYNVNNIVPNNAKYKILILLFIPILSIIGSIIANIYIVSFIIIIISLIYMLSVLSSNVISYELYPFIIIILSISLLLQNTLFLNYLIGSDVHLENYVYELTLKKEYWSIISINPLSSTPRFSAMLSITILPTVFSQLLNINGSIIFKIIYPIIFSLVPLTLYKIYENQFDKKYSLISIFYFISNESIFFGIEPLSLARQIIGMFFLVLLILLLLETEISLKNKKILFYIFSIALIFSHYSIAYIYFAYLIFMYVFRERSRQNQVITLSSIIYVLIIILLWYVYISDSIFYKLLDNLKNMYLTFIVDFLNPSARSPLLTRLLTPTPSTVTRIHRIIFYIMHILILIGFIKNVLFSENNKLNYKFKLLSILSMIFLLMCFVIPNFALSLNFTRFRAITMLFLSPYFVLGGNYLINLIDKIKYISILKSKNLHFISFLLICFFLFQIGFFNHIMQDKPISYTLDLNRLKNTDDIYLITSFYNSYIPAQDVTSAQWLFKNINEESTIYSDLGSKFMVLTSYGLIDRQQVSELKNNTILWPQTYIYLRYLNVIKGIGYTYGRPYDITKYSATLVNQTNKIYSNGNSEIYYCMSYIRIFN